MRKLLPVMTVIVSGILAADVFAAAASTTPTYGGATAPSPQGDSHIMSTDAYKSTTEKMSTDSKNNLNQTVQQQIKAFTPPSSTSAPASSSSSTPGQNNNTAAQPEQNNDDINANADGTTNPQQPAAPSSGTSQPARPIAAPPQTTTSPTSNPDIYTGFGSGQNNQNQKSNSGGTQNKGSNWNVGY